MSIGNNKIYSYNNPRKKRGTSDSTKENKSRSSQFGNLRNKALRKGIEYNLHHRDVIWPDVCPILGIKLERTSLRSNNGSSPSVDRIDPTEGYTKDNIRIISRLANTMKSNATPEQLEMFAKNIGPYLRGEL